MSNTSLSASDSIRSSLTVNEAEVLRHLRAIRYGQITVQVHDARIVQIDRTEKFRTESRSTDLPR